MYAQLLRMLLHATRLCPTGVGRHHSPSLLAGLSTIHRYWPEENSHGDVSRGPCDTKKLPPVLPSPFSALPQNIVLEPALLALYSGTAAGAGNELN